MPSITSGGYLKIAPEAISEGPLSKMMKPGVGAYYRFKQLFDRYSKAAGKEQYLIPYFIAAHPGTTDEDMLELALWLKQNGFRADQVQAFLPGPMATATAMYHSGKNPLRRVTRTSEDVPIPKGLKVRRLHKAFLRYHDPNNWPMLRAALKRMGREDLIGNGKHHLVPRFSPKAPAMRPRDAGPRARRRSVRSTCADGWSPRVAGGRDRCAADWVSGRSVELTYQRLRSDQPIAALDDARHLSPIDDADVETQTEPAARTDVGRQVESRGLAARAIRVLAKLRLHANGDDAVAVMVVEKIREHFLAHEKGHVTPLLRCPRFR